ncbi:MAG: type II/IV secretion system protein [Pirellulales bacterium]|nr:type II/IV secretion system protein [Pirellulales bacterium]
MNSTATPRVVFNRGVAPRVAMECISQVTSLRSPNTCNLPMPTLIEKITGSMAIEDANYATVAVDRLLSEAVTMGASDIHLQPVSEGLWIRWRIDGVLQPVGTLPGRIAPNIVARLKVLAGLLTYQTDRPQEGRLRDPARNLDVRISTFPILCGEKVVIRILSTGAASLRNLAQLGFPTHVADQLHAALNATSGAILLVGPAGSGKTTTAYACLRALVQITGGGRSIATLEDPIEVALDGVAQSQVRESAGFDLATGLRSLVRQDPEVIFVGEIRDPQTAVIAFQAAMTGQLMLTTFHAGTAVEAVTRLLDMGIPPYILRGTIRVIVAQRLLRRLCKCAKDSDPNACQADNLKGLANMRAHGTDEESQILTASPGALLNRCREPAGCEACQGTGYLGRCVTAEILTFQDTALAQAILDRADSRRLAELASATGAESISDTAIRLVNEGVTSPAEWFRLFGMDHPQHP